MSKIGITCEQASTICTKVQYGEASLSDKIKLNFHLLFCKICRRFSKQNAKLTTMCSTVKSGKEAEVFSLSNEDKESLKEQIKQLENKY